MSAGYHLYGQIFCSQPPFFLISVYPFYELLGSTITSARIGVAILSLLGLVGAYLIGKALAGRAGAVAAVILLLFTPIYLEQSHLLRAEGPAIGFLCLAVGTGFMWSEHPTGRKGMVFAVLCGITLALGMLIKLLDVLALVPIALLVVVRICRLRREPGPQIWISLQPIIAAVVAAAIITTLIVLAPFVGPLNALIDQVITFHLAAKKMMIASQSENISTLRQFLFANRVLTAATIISAAVTIMRRDWRIVPLLAWLVATLAFVIFQVPLWPRHVIVLVPPLIAILVLGLKGLPGIPTRRPVAWEQRGALLVGLLALAVVARSARHDYHYYLDTVRGGPNPADQQMAQFAADLERVTTPDQWILGDAQFATALAGRDTPPWLVDTSFTRISSGYLTSQELI